MNLFFQRISLSDFCVLESIVVANLKPMNSMFLILTIITWLTKNIRDPALANLNSLRFCELESYAAIIYGSDI